MTPTTTFNLKKYPNKSSKGHRNAFHTYNSALKSCNKLFFTTRVIYCGLYSIKFAL